jgi:hypothetical protein
MLPIKSRVSVYIPVELQRQIRAHFVNCCAYCLTAESLTVTIFEFEHILPRSAGGETVFDNLCLACPLERVSGYREPKKIFDRATRKEGKEKKGKGQKWKRAKGKGVLTQERSRPETRSCRTESPTYTHNDAPSGNSTD